MKAYYTVRAGWQYLLRFFVLVALVVTPLGSLAVSPISTAQAADTTDTATDVGYRDFSYSGTTAPTGEKPQSKLWFNDGLWWGALFNRSTAKFSIYSLDGATQSWTDTGTVIDERDTSGADVLWDGSKLYVATAGPSSTTASDSGRILRYSYEAATKTYSLDDGFPITVTNGGMEAIVLDKDTTGTLWVTYTQSSKVYVTHSATDGTNWVTPYVLPVTGATGLLEEDISAVVSYNGKIGVMWSNQVDWAFYFATHVDGRPDSEWTVQAAHQGPEESDNHINLKSLQADDSGQVFAAVKTSLNADDAPLIMLLRMKKDGIWAQPTVFSRVAEQHTRAIVVINQELRKLYMFASAPCCSGGVMYYKQTPLDNISFPEGMGVPFIQSSTDPEINNATTTKQALTSASGLVVLASDDSTKYYLHNSILPGVSAPDTVIDSGPPNTTNSSSAKFTFSSNETGSTFECRLDDGTFQPCTSPQEYSGLVNGSHAFEVRAMDAAGKADPSPASWNWTIDTSIVSDTFTSEADAHVEQASPDTNFGTSTSLFVDRSSTATMETFLRFTVSGISGTVESAKLRVYAHNGSTDGPAVHSTSSDWSETAVTWNTRPATTGSAIDDKSEVSENTWVEYDVTAMVTSDGTYNFALVPTSGDGMDMYSREASEYKPQLFLEINRPPDTTIDSGPADTTSSTSASFTFSSSESGSTFECKLNTAAYETCASPMEYAELPQGSHTFQVRAIDSAKNVDPTPASRTWAVDTGVPETTIDAKPSDPSNDTSPTFAFSADEADVTFECSLDGGDWESSCVSPKEYSGLPHGDHTFQVRATDSTGNVDTSPAGYAWSLDIVAPAAPVITDPADNSLNGTGSVTISGTADASVEIEVFDGQTSMGATIAADDGQWNKSFSGVTDGSHAYTAKAADKASNTSDSSNTVRITVDTVPPETTLDGKPSDPSNDSEPDFSFSSSEASATFQCRLDTGDWESCISPKGYTPLADGTHAFEVRSVDAAGNIDTSPADHTWVVDTVSPDSTIDSGPSGTIDSTSASFEFSSNEAATTFECQLDGAAFDPCSSPKQYTGLSDGEHNFHVRAIDRAGNYDASPAARSWTVDTSAPDTSPPSVSLTKPDDGAMVAGSVTLSAEAMDNIAVERVEFLVNDKLVGTDLDGSDGHSVSWDSGTVSDGTGTIVARAFDTSDNSTTSASRSVTVDNTAPDTVIESGASGTATTNAATFTFSATESHSAFECRLDSTDEADYESCGSPQEYNGLADGTHSFDVRSTDSAGNTDTEPASRTWTVDTTAPETAIDSEPPPADNNTLASFSFSANETGSTFTCALDGGDFHPCTSPQDYSGLSDGPHTFGVKATDSAGNVDATPATRSWTVDTVRPTAKAPYQRFVWGSSLGTTLVPVKSNWSATDDATGISKYDLQQSVNGGGYASVTLPTDTTTSYTAWLTPTYTYRFRIRAQDGAGNWSYWQYGPSFTVDAHQESSSAITYTGTWTTATLSGAYGGSTRYATASGEKARFSFTGRSVAWVAPKSTTRGEAKIYLDGVYVTKVNLYSSTTYSRRVVYTKSWSSSTSHTLDVVLVGTAGHPQVDVDAFIVLR